MVSLWEDFTFSKEKFELTGSMGLRDPVAETLRAMGLMGPLCDYYRTTGAFCSSMGEVAAVISFFLYVTLEGGPFVSLKGESIGLRCYLMEMRILSPGGMIWKRKGLIQLLGIFMPAVTWPQFHKSLFSSVCLGACSSQSLEELCLLPINYDHFFCGLWQPQAIRW